MEDRWYQSESSDATIECIDKDVNAAPLVVAPTGAGKTIIMCLIIDKYLSKHPTHDVVVLSHNKYILRQNHAALEGYFEIDIGLYSASLKSRTINKITVAGIQSVYNKGCMFNSHKCLFLIDEAHMVPTRGEGMYRTFMQSQHGSILAGLTATHYRLGHGYIHKGDGALFNSIAYDLSSFENFNRLVDEGYLSKLYSKSTECELNTEGLKTTGGEFNIKAMVERFDRDAITDAAIDETVKYGKKYKKWLIFAIEIEHAEHIVESLARHGITAACVHSKRSDAENDQIIEDFKAGKYRAIVNVNMLTIGFDVPDIDLIVLLRPTESPSLHVQMVGRGLRVVYAIGMPVDTIEQRLAAIEAGPKQHCLVLDFAGNTARLGPINDIKVKQKGEPQGDGEPITKQCPECGVIQHPSVRFCDSCGYEFIFKQKIQSQAHNDAIVKTEEQPLREWVKVDDVKYSIHQKRGKPSSLRVTYKSGFVSFSEWVGIDHGGREGYRARHWVNFRWLGDKSTFPSNLNELYKSVDRLKTPTMIHVDNTSKFPRIIDAKF